MRSQPNRNAINVPYDSQPAVNTMAAVWLDGEDLITNGSFTVDGTGWTLGTGDWTVGAGVCTHAVGAGSVVFQSPTLTGAAHLHIYTVGNRTDGEVNARVGDVAGTARTANGSYGEMIKNSSLTGNSGAVCNGTFDGSIDNVAVYEFSDTCADPQTLHVVKAIEWSYDTAPTGGKVEIFGPDGILWGVDITAAGPDGAEFPHGLHGERGDGICALLSNGSTLVTGKLNLIMA